MPMSSFCFLLKFNCTFSITNKILTNYSLSLLYFNYNSLGRRDTFFRASLLLSILTPLFFFCSSSVFLTDLILAVPMRECL